MKSSAIVALFLCLAASSAFGQSALPAEPARGPYLGILFSPLDGALRAKLPPDQGVKVTHVLPDSPAANVGIRRDDVLLAYDGAKIRDVTNLVAFIQSSKPEQVVKLLVIRGEQSLNLSVKLGLGPVLRMASLAPNSPPGVGKANGPSPLTVTAVPMDKNRLKVTFEFPNAGRIQVVDCEGDVAEIDRQIRDLPPKVQTLALTAVRRLRELDLQKSETNPKPERRN